ncbi:MAG: SoxR reducing system RseC family protein [Desulfatiglandaceae bacterium]
MVREQGIVEKITGKKAVIRIERTSACATCESRGHCEIGSNKKMVVEVLNELSACSGDRVEVSIPTGSFLKLSLLVYLFPVLALVAGAYAGGEWAGSLGINPTPASIVSGGLSTAVAFVCLRILDRRFRVSGQTGPRMTRILFREP